MRESSAPNYAVPLRDLKFKTGREVELQGKLYVFPPLTARATLRAQEVSQKAALELLPLVSKLKALKTRSEVDVSTMDPTQMQALMEELNAASDLLPKVNNQELVTAITVGHICLSQNYPDISEDAYADMVTAEQAKDLFQWAMFGDVVAKKS